MNLSNLSLSQSPPFFQTIRFFIAAPVFAGLCGLILIFGGAGGGFLAFASPNSFPALAFIHAFTLGFMLFSMLGALQQMLPVVGGVVLRCGAGLSNLVFFASLLGAPLVVGGFFFAKTQILFFGAAVLFVAVSLFCAAASLQLFGARFLTPTIRAMRLAVIFLVFVLFCGVLMARFFGFGEAWLGIETYFAALSRAHISAALFGWIFLLIVGVSYQVLPMFYVAPDFHKRFTKFFIYIVILAFFANLFSDLAARFLHFLGAIFGAYAIVILRRRRRKNTLDTTICYWYFSLFCLVAACILGVFGGEKGAFYPKILLFIFGFGGGLINGMLFKIVPFLAWFHLSSSGDFSIPSIREIIPERLMAAQFVAFVCAVLALVFGAFSGVFLPAGILLLIAAILQFCALFLGVRVYFRCSSRAKK